MEHCFCFLTAEKNSAVVNMDVQVSQWHVTLRSFRVMLTVRLSASRENSILSFLRTSYIAFYSVDTSLHSCQWCIVIPFFTPLPEFDTCWIHHSCADWDDKDNYEEGPSLHEKQALDTKEAMHVKGRRLDEARGHKCCLTGFRLKSPGVAF